MAEESEPTGKPSPLEFIPTAVRARGRLSIRWRPVLVPVAAVSAILLGGLFLEYPLIITADCTFSPAVWRAVRAEIDGVLQSVEVIEGARVTPGQVLARLDSRDLDADLGQVRSQIEAARARLERSQKGASREEILRADRIVSSRQSQQAAAATRLERWQNLHASKVASDEQLTEARRAMTHATDALREAQANARLVRAGSRAQEIGALEIELQKLRAEENFLTLRLSKIDLVSPLAGVVTTARVQERAGLRVEVGREIVRVAADGELRIDILVPETEIDALRPGLPVTARASGFPSHTFSGQVSFVSPAAELIGGRRVVRVSAVVKDGGIPIKFEMTGTAELDAGKRPLYRLAWRRLLRLFWLPSLLT